jgi:hypothetical protein
MWPKSFETNKKNEKDVTKHHFERTKNEIDVGQHHINNTSFFSCSPINGALELPFCIPVLSLGNLPAPGKSACCQRATAIFFFLSLPFFYFLEILRVQCSKRSFTSGYK